MNSSSFGIYIHIPYCLQRCTYCDFATYEKSKILPPGEYVDLLKKEIQFYQSAFSQKKLDTIYFGGGTPSLIDAELIVSILNELANNGFQTHTETEITLEINPATIDEKKMDLYLRSGINRFSVGAQSFNDTLLKSVHREHNAQQTRETLSLLEKHQVNFSFDILFALPGQTLDDLKRDLNEVAFFAPHHVSPYCLTVVDSHPLAKLRLHEDIQLEMFSLISENLKSLNYHQYEISNFAKQGFHSRHNSLYWNDSDYWGIGLSSHSYSKTKPWGMRYWNPSNIHQYQKTIESLSSSNKFKQETDNSFSHLQKLEFESSFSQNLSPNHQTQILRGRNSENFEILEAHQALTDICHTSLRTSTGLNLLDIQKRFGEKIFEMITHQMKGLEQNGSVQQSSSSNWRLTEEGILVSNQVFAALTFLKEEISSILPS